jgi:hypothetical protein
MIKAANLKRPLPALQDLLNGEDVRVKELLQRLSKEIHDFVGSPLNRANFIERYSALVNAQMALPRIAVRKRSDTAVQEDSSTAVREDYDTTGFTTLTPVWVNIYSDRGIVAATGMFISEIQGLQRGRLRKCETCKQIFWAQQVNSWCCKLRCRKSYNQREFRRAKKELAAGREIRKVNKK